MTTFWLLFITLLIGWVYCPNAEETTPCTWDCMLYTLQWPGSFCVSLRMNTDCRIPQNIKNWTIHGLWPMHSQKCCCCWPIFHSDLEELEPELSQLWPSLLKHKSSFLFWKEEWFKHGTCAACAEGMNSPMRYFQISLKLRKHFDIDGILADAGIKHSCNQSYQVDELHRALASVLVDTRYEIQCVTDDKFSALLYEHRKIQSGISGTFGREVWVQLKIPLSRNQTLGCHKEEQGQRDRTLALGSTSQGHPCPQHSPVFYFPIDYEHPDQPCD